MMPRFGKPRPRTFVAFQRGVRGLGALGDALLQSSQALNPGDHIRVTASWYSLFASSGSVLDTLNSVPGPVEWTDAQLGSIITQSPAQLYGTVQQPTTVSDLIDWLNANLGGNWDIFSFGVAGVYSTGAIAGGPLESYGVPPGSTLDVGQTGTDTTTTPSGDKVLGYGLLALALVWGVKQFI